MHHDDCLSHNPGKMHPESSQRVRVVLEALQGMAGVEKLPAPLATLEQISRAHDLEYWQGVVEAEPGEAASQREVFRHNPHHLRGKTLYYSSAIGTERHLADVILDQVADFDAKYHEAR